MVDMGKEKQKVEDFSAAMDNQLGEFEFPQDFVADVWTAISITRDTS